MPSSVQIKTSWRRLHLGNRFPVLHRATAPSSLWATGEGTAAESVSSAAFVKPEERRTYGTRQYRLVLLMSGELSVVQTQRLPCWEAGQQYSSFRLCAAGALRVFYRGLRGLGSAIGKQDSAHFVEILFDAFPSALHSIRLLLQQDTNVLRFMILNLEKQGVAL
ncbi:ribosomal protein [Cyclospora cayetanensis]|uniref:Ribosomal protein n=1 Tax=Cyclospora cayetanensis TaxID=88456 RepID=A0A1D3D8I8_9EIME|nr:ribosomal protein [Cyclospora cayetanensis]